MPLYISEMADIHDIVLRRFWLLHSVIAISSQHEVDRVNGSVAEETAIAARLVAVSPDAPEFGAVGSKRTVADILACLAGQIIVRRLARRHRPIHV